MLVDCALYSDGKRESVGMAEAIRKARSVPGSFVWLGLHEPTYDEFDDLALYFAPHPLAIEDAVNAHQRPKLDVYDECLFVVLKTLDYDDRGPSSSAARSCCLREILRSSLVSGL